MRRLENYLKIENIDKAKKNLVPFIFSENYYRILKARMKGKKLTKNEQYYYNHFIKKKLEAMFELLDINEVINGKEYIRSDRLNKAINIIKKYERKHKKLLISGSFLYSKTYNDIDLFIISKYNKEDYREGIIHINYLPKTIENTLFLSSLQSLSIANFSTDTKIKETFSINDLLHLYEVVILLILQHDEYLQELRDLILRLEYLSGNIVLNSFQLKIMTDKIMSANDPIQLINKYFIAKIVQAYKKEDLITALTHFIKKNTVPEKGKVYKNWHIYNQTYREVKEIVA